jgi:hypothetical protein
MVTLGSFSQASGLIINEDKSSGYWWHPREQVRLAWTNDFRWQWAVTGDVSKLLDSPFGLILSSTDVDNFLLTRLEKKL